ncbi:DUF975 family protein [Lactobacillus sp. ESL0731]|uniref:DUF975 family protein n=1 Tax=unclassified Lactobacillus TaxID=2620435 RepID=UPI0023F7AAB7|nr:MULTISPECIES: DUF975 family protein [unclassified Lactobacillus]WEV51110.1 DUF975 family protein [Lactobacillus sp. ESL0700]WEV62239.1 DUF975 family protein [Lactobacillus sp. ESL0731]
MTRAELKAEAKEKLRGNWRWAIGVALIISVINLIVSSPSYMQFAVRGNIAGMDYKVQLQWLLQIGLSIFISFFALSYAVTFLNLCDGRKDNIVKSAFSAFYDNLFIPELLNYLMQNVFEILWLLLLVIPGLIKSYSYAMTPYIVKDMVDSGQHVSFTAGVTASKDLMAGHKWELFVLDLSFMGWYILLYVVGGLISFGLTALVSVTSLSQVFAHAAIVGLCVGIGSLVLTPYIQATKAEFYRNLAGNQFRE